METRLERRDAEEDAMSLLCVCVSERVYGGVTICCGCGCVAECVQDGWSCLLIACQNGHLEVVKYLHGAGGEALLMMTKKVRLVMCGQMRGHWKGGGCGC